MQSTSITNFFTYVSYLNISRAQMLILPVFIFQPSMFSPSHQMCSHLNKCKYRVKCGQNTLLLFWDPMGNNQKVYSSFFPGYIQPAHKWFESWTVPAGIYQDSNCLSVYARLKRLYSDAKKKKGIIKGRKQYFMEKMAVYYKPLFFFF